MKNFWTSLKKRWFIPVAPERLALLRIATGLFCLWYLFSRYDMLQRMIRNADAFEPVGMLSWMKQPLEPNTFWWISLVLIGLNLCFIFGWKFRITGPAFALLALLFFTYRNSWSMIYHNRNALVLHMVILGLVASADAWSLDSWNKRRKGLRKKQENWKYGWPVMLICAVTVGSYFLSGVAKLAGDLALEWANGSAMRSQVAVDAIRKSVLGAETAPLFNVIYKHTWLFLVMGVFTFLVELGAPLALLHKRLGKLWAVLTFGMHWGIFFIMGITFRYQMSGLIFLSFFEPEKLFSNQKKKPVLNNAKSSLQKLSETSPIVLFDGACNLCNGWVQFILRYEREAEISFASLQSEPARQLLESYGLRQDLSSIVLVEDQNLFQKSDAILKIIEKLRLPWSLMIFFTFIPRPLRNTAYSFVARYRYTWFGKRDRCDLFPQAQKLRFIE
ncbi:DCC1-like thiol-disulfide oxidoreductase family protein [Poritiphilus flavus]|nr:DCC1-like thiol-disulfide oxidoreductase family protein [Poritiphilus flavus]